MLIYIILIILTIIGCELLKKRPTIHSIYNILIYVIPLSLRNMSMGLNDVEKIYYVYFRRMENQLIGDLKNFIFKDYFFYYFMYFCKKIWNNYNFFLTVVAIPYLFSFFRLLKKYSSDILMSCLMFLALSYWGYEFTVLRHCMAVALTIRSYDYIQKKEFLKFIVCIAIATLFHATAIIFLPAYFLDKTNFKLKYFGMIGVLGLILFMFKNKIMSLIFLLISGTRFSYFKENVTELSPTLFFINFLILLLSYFSFQVNKKKYNAIEKKEINLLLNVVCVGTIISMLSMVFGEANRLSMFYSIFNVLLLPNTLSKYTQKNRIIIKSMLNVIFIIYFLLFSLSNMNMVPYIFF